MKVILQTIKDVELDVPAAIDVCGETVSYDAEPDPSGSPEDVAVYRRTLYFGDPEDPGTEYADVCITADGHGAVRAHVEMENGETDETVFETYGDPGTVGERIKEAAKRATAFVCERGGGNRTRKP